ncbi:MAG TPA: family 20 glycosylhydrolase [Burkholderiaceae bacterium]|jgi:hexosaminidase
MFSLKKSFRILGLCLMLIPVAVPAASAESMNLMPVPAEVTPTAGKLRLTKDFSVTISGNARPELAASATRFLRRLDGRAGLFFKHTFPATDPVEPNPTFIIDCGLVTKPALASDESYVLEVGPSSIKLSAPTNLGVMHGLETLLQLLAADDQGYYFPQVAIHDKPRFPWRGLMIDAARHFIPVDTLKRNIDGMAAVKLNVLHLHLTDNQGFRIESKTFPKLHQLSGEEYYSQAEIRQLVDYAAARGIRIVPEFDLPAHATSWLAAYPELGSRHGSYQTERLFGIFDPVMDPTREETYRFLEKFFAEILPLFPDEYVHIGGDENVKGLDWKENPDIQQFMKAHQIADNNALQTYFNKRMLKIFSGLHRKMIGWDEILNADLPRTSVVQVWRGKADLLRAASLGYQTILSDGYYIDLMHETSEYYLNDPILPMGKKMPAQMRQNILGGEATMWSELVSAQNIDSRIWPRTAAISERLWSPANIRDVDDMYRRLDNVSVRLEELGLTHITSREVIMRNLAGGTNDTKAVQVLLDVVEPLKDYKRNGNDVMYSVASPFTLFADAANTDARAARRFSVTMNRFLAQGNPADRAALRAALVSWRDNHAAILALIKLSPNLKEVEQLSAHLREVSELALDLLDRSAAMNEARRQSAEVILKAAQEQGGRTELQIVEPIRKLVEQRFQESGSSAK